MDRGPSISSHYLRVERVLRLPEDYESSVTAFPLGIDLLRRSQRPGSVEQFQGADWGIDFGEAAMDARVRGTLPEGCFSMCLVLEGESVWHGLEGRAGSLFCVPGGRELDGRIAPGFRWITLAMSADAWESGRAAARTDERRLNGFRGWRAGEGLPALVARLLDCRRVLQFPGAGGFPPEAATGAAVVALREAACLAWTLAGGEFAERDAARNRFRLARRAEGWMRARLGETISVPDVCLALGASRREIEYAFRQTFDRGPGEHLRILRLNAIRRALLRDEERGDKTIARIAADRGMYHLGRFAAHYRALFGESPRETAPPKRTILVVPELRAEGGASS